MRVRAARLRLGVLTAALVLSGAASGRASDAPAENAPAPVSEAPASAEPGPPAWAYGMAHDLMSPFCPGRTLEACPSPQAEQLRQWIVFQAVAGRSREDIEKSLYDRYGDAILSAPRARGWGLSAYVVPVLAFVLGGGLVAFVLRRIVSRTPAPAAAAAASPAAARSATSGLDDAELERLVDEELSHL